MPDDKIRTPEQKAKQREASRRHYVAHRDEVLRRHKEYRQRPSFKIQKKQYNSTVNSRVARANFGPKWALRNPNKITEYQIKERQQQENELTAIAGRPRPDKCDVCGGDTGGIVFDHCHKHGHFRGWLCWRCNIVLGHVQDDPILLEILAAYLREPPPDTPPPQPTLPGI